MLRSNTEAHISQTPPEILTGWRRVHSGPAEIGDRRWSARLQGWIPVIKGDGFCGVDVKQIVSIVIRRG